MRNIKPKIEMNILNGDYVTMYDVVVHHSDYEPILTTESRVRQLLPRLDQPFIGIDFL